MKPTQQQTSIIEAASAGANLVIKAFAGAGKTSTLSMVANAVQKPSLYIAFNKSIAEEASKKFPQHVTCKTMHSLAWGSIIKSTRSPLGKKLQGFWNLEDIADPVLPQDDIIPFKLEVTGLVTAFCQSADLSIAEFAGKVTSKYPGVASAAVKLWNDASNASSTVGMTHDVYLKMFQLQHEVLPYSCIYLDEAQDSNPVTLAIVATQKHAQKIIVGDTYQSIYGWRGAVNALDSLPSSFQTMYLSESFRFNQSIADMATKLTAIAGNTVPVVGHGTETELKSRAILVRNNSTLLDILLTAYDKGEKVHVLADLTDLWSKVYHISALFFKQVPRYANKELSQYKNYAQLLTAAESLPELKKLIKATIKLSDGGLSTNINNIKSIIVGEADADYTVSTVHKSKGLEWQHVTICDDILFQKEDQTLAEALMDNQTLNLIYVAVTRAKVEVVVPDDVMDVLWGWESLREDWAELLDVPAEGNAG